MHRQRTGRCNEANTRSSSAPRAPSTQTALEVVSQSSASGSQQHLSISHGPVVNIVLEVQSEDDAGTTTKTLPTRQTQRSSDDPNPEPSFRLAQPRPTYRQGNQERSQSIGTTCSTPLNLQARVVQVEIPHPRAVI
jgi:hypothetical protein